VALSITFVDSLFYCATALIACFPILMGQGFHLGQRRLGACKRTPYDHDIRVPFLMSGPGITPGIHVSAMTSLVDVAPTLLDLAGTRGENHGLAFDGKSMKRFILSSPPPSSSSTSTFSASLSPSSSLSLLSSSSSSSSNSPPWRDAVLIEYAATTAPGSVSTEKDGDWRHPHPKDVSNNSFAGLRIYTGGGSRGRPNDRAVSGGGGDGNQDDGRDWAYFEIFDAWQDWNFAKEPQAFMLFDLRKDPEQLENIYTSTDEGTRRELHRHLHEELACRGSSCA
jgi:arylsulfatase A-like enzyme